MKITKNKIEYTAEEKELAKISKALAHPFRVAILNYLDLRNTCYTGDLVEIFPMAQSTISQHIKELRNAGLIKGEVNPPKTQYCINKENWEKAKKLYCDFFNIEFDNHTCSV